MDVERHVVPMVKTALDLGIRTFDSAVLYRATLQLGRALESLSVDPRSIRFQTKCLRYLGLKAGGAIEHQPDALLQGIPRRYQNLTDKWDTSPEGVEQQICRERIEYGGDVLHGVALHDLAAARVASHRHAFDVGGARRVGHVSRPHHARPRHVTADRALWHHHRHDRDRRESREGLQHHT